MGDVCIYLGDPEDEDDAKYRGKRIIVRRIKPDWGIKVDDDLANPAPQSDRWTWAAWVEGKQLAKIEGATP